MFQHVQEKHDRKQADMSGSSVRLTVVEPSFRATRPLRHYDRSGDVSASQPISSERGREACF